MFFSICFFFFSCASLSFNSDEWRTVSKISDLYGTWVSSQGEYVYPFELDGKKYIRYSWAQSDDTEIWKKFASSKEMDLSDLWEKRFSLAPYIYSSPEKFENIPDSDENDIQTGRKYFINDEKIYSRVEVLIPERLVSINLDFFILKKDGNALREQGKFNLASNKFPDIIADDTLYYKMGDVKSTEKIRK